MHGKRRAIFREILGMDGNQRQKSGRTGQDQRRVGEDNHGNLSALEKARV